MIIKGGPRRDGAFYAAHLMRTDTNECVEVKEYRGLSATSVRGALNEMALMAEGTRATNPFYIVSMNPCGDERLSEAQWRFAVDRLEDELGLTGQPRFIVEHLKEDRTHIHVGWSRIDADTMTAIPADNNYMRHETAARAAELELGLRQVESVLVKGEPGERPERRAKDWESFRSADTGIDPQAMKVEITGLWHAADSGTAFKASLEEAGYILAKGDRRDFCVIDQAGDDHSLARRISGEKAAGIRARMNDIDRDALPGVAEARQMARGAMSSRAGAVEPAEPGAAIPPVPSRLDMQVAEGADRQLGDVPQLSPQAEAELAARYGDWSAAPSGTPSDWQTAEPGEGADQRPEFTGWERFAGRMRDYWERFVAFVQDESSRPAVDADAAPEAQSWVAKVGRQLSEGVRHFTDLLGMGEARDVDLGDPDASPGSGHDRDPGRPGANVDTPEPDDAPQQSAAAPVDAWQEHPAAQSLASLLWNAYEDAPDEDSAAAEPETPVPDAPEPDPGLDIDL